VESAAGDDGKANKKGTADLKKNEKSGVKKIEDMSVSEDGDPVDLLEDLKIDL